MSNQFCTSCGHSVALDAKFCDNCGAVFGAPKLPEFQRKVEIDPPTTASTTGTHQTVVKHARLAISAWVIPFNATLIFGSTLVAAFDFLSPRVALLPIAATVAVVGLLAALALRKYVAPSLPEGSTFRRALAPEMGLHKSPVLIVTAMLSALMVSGAAWSSAASASGGVIASKFDAARNAQMQFGVLQAVQKEQRVQTAVLEDIREGRSSDPRRELSNLGSGWDSSSFQYALVNGDARVVSLFIEGKMQWRISDAFVVMVLNKQEMLDLLLKSKSLLVRLEGDCVKIIDERVVSPHPFVTHYSRDLESGASNYKAFANLKKEHINFLRMFCEGADDVASINQSYSEFQKKYDEQKRLMGGYVGPAMNEWNRHSKIYQEVVKQVNKSVE